MAWRQSGFWQQYVAAIVLAVIFSAALAGSTASLLDAVLGRALEDVLGPADEYTLIVHVQARAEDAAAQEIHSLVEEASSAAPVGLTVRQGPTVAGNANFMVAIPERSLSSALLERLPLELQRLSGFNGHTWLLEPSVTVAAPERGAGRLIAEEAAGWDGVRAFVRHGSRVTFIVEDEAARSDVTGRLNDWLEGRQIATVRWAEGTPASAPSHVLTALEQGLSQHSWRVVDGTSGDGEGAGTPFDDAATALSRLPAAWEQLTSAGAVTEQALRQLIDLLDALEPALALTEAPDRQAARLADSLRAGNGAEAVKDVLLNVAVAMLWQSMTDGGTAAKAAVADGEIVAGDDASVSLDGTPSELAARWEQTRDALTAAADDAAEVSALSRSDLTSVTEAIAAVEQFLPAAEEATGMTLLVDDSLSPDTIEGAVRGAFSGVFGHHRDARVSIEAPGMIEPNPRMILSDLRADVRSAVAGLLALLAAAAVLVFDHAVVFAAWPALSSARGRSAFAAAGVGAVLFVSTYVLAGGGVPGMNGGPGGVAAVVPILIIAFLGMLIGVGTSRFADRISPVDEAELLAGRSLGLTDGQLLSEIVIPRGRPGFLTFLNTFRRQFH